jgi:hypothetical protein
VSCAGDTSNSRVEELEVRYLSSDYAFIHRWRNTFVGQEFEHESWDDEYRVAFP